MRTAAGFLVAALVAAPAAAQSVCPVHTGRDAAVWSPPFDRVVTIHAGALPLADALERITAAARVRISYSADLLPADRTVCVNFDGVAIGTALATVLRGTDVAPVAAGRTHVVLTPSAPGRGTAPHLTQQIIPLGEISVYDVARAPVPVGTAAASVNGRELPAGRSLSLGGALSGVVPGVWLWRQQNGVLAQHGSMRGMNAFGGTPPKVLIDGIEVANPMLVSHIDPVNIERIDVVHGPHGGALYGTDASHGVINIVTRRGLGEEQPGVSVRSVIGMVDYPTGSSPALEQQHTFSVRGANDTGAGRIDFGFAGSEADPINPSGAQRFFTDVGARRISGRLILNATARFVSERTGASLYPGTTGVPRVLSIDYHTLGVTAGFTARGWTHTLVAGLDGYTLGGGPTLPEARSAADSTLAAAGLGASRTTLRLTSTRRLRPVPQADASVAFGLHHSKLNRRNNDMPFVIYDESGQPTGYLPGSPRVDGLLGEQRLSSGVSALTEVTLLERFDLRGGLRAERSGLTPDLQRVVLLPTAGATLRALDGPVDVSLRAAYGRGISWPQVLYNQQLTGTPLRAVEPEVQSGIEAGADVSVGSAHVHVTRFRQLSEGLLQYVPEWSEGQPGGYALQNVGAIANLGWELGAGVGVGAFTMSATMTFTDSRVLTLADSYAGELFAGDRVLGVPAYTLGARLAWVGTDWEALVSVRRARDWINYDRLRLAADAQAGIRPAGLALRDYWVSYDGATTLGGSIARRVGSRLLFHASADNLLNQLNAEPDNLLMQPGRSLSAGVRLNF